ncbi:MAG: polyribonucleotide nucleotidyltransferase [Chlamydiales bacterium]|nr:polyribonucleotide nucleotidyltransferase [Chlamydiales bacterium]
MKSQTLTVSVSGKTLTFETGKIARQAGGSVLLRSGDTVILSTACAAKAPDPAVDFFPLRVDYIEKFSSAGKTLGGFIKREGKLSEKEVLVSRLIDRPLRPMFEDGYFNEVQVLNYVMSYDSGHPPEALAICAASAALVISEIPLKKPIAGVKVGMINDEFIINPTSEELKNSRLDLILAGTVDAILMIEGYADFLTEEQILEAIEEGHKAIQIICQHLSDWQQVVGKEKVRDNLVVIPDELKSGIDTLIGKKLQDGLRISEKLKREELLSTIHSDTLEHYLGENSKQPYSKPQVELAYKEVSSRYMREMILSENIRADGRSCEEIRPIFIEQSLLPRAHGSALFTRGETQSLAVCTLGPETMGQRFETLEGEGLSRFYLQYSFPPFSVGEVGRMGPPGRREVGHGKLAERALMAALPDITTFPYTIRLESNITESNGSSSMASVCGGCLSMMDAGVPITRPVAGIAMGLLLEQDRFAILSDILGVEDALGDMDFKVTGDAHGITAFQLDIKVEGITHHIMESALKQAKQGRLHILNKMIGACPESKKHLSQYAPRIETIQIPTSKIALLIGPGGKQIRAIIEETGVDININDDGVVSIASVSVEAMDRAKELVHNVVAEVEVGKTYKGEIVSIVPFGLFVKIFSREGLCHISEIDHKRLDTLEGLFKIGESIEVKVLEINDRGQIKLSRKVLLPRPSHDEGSSGESHQREPRREHREQREPRKPMVLTPPPININS